MWSYCTGWNFTLISWMYWACTVEIWIAWRPLFTKRPSFSILLFLLFFTILAHPPDWRYKMLAFVPVHRHLPGFLWSLNQKGIIKMQLVFFHRNHLLDKLASFVGVLMGTQWEVTFPSGGRVGSRLQATGPRVKGKQGRDGSPSLPYL